MKSTISSKGQVTVPIKVRESLGLTPGSVVNFEVREGGAFLKKGYRGDHPVDTVYGRLKLDRPVDEVVDEMRGPRPAKKRPTRKMRGRPKK